MRVAVVTWTKFNNYGTFVQAYALKEIIKELGHEVKILDDNLIWPENINNDFPKKNIIKKIVTYPFDFKNRKKYQLLNEENNKKEVKFIEFKDKYLSIDDNSYDYRYLNDYYDAFICGSDQIWDMTDKVFCKHYYLDFVNDNNLKISYAPSCGKTTDSKNKHQLISNLLRNFDSISVREETGRDLLQNFTDKNISVVLDPTCLIDVKSWDLIASKRLIKEKYLFCYFLGNKTWYRNYALKVAKEKKIKLVILSKLDIDKDSPYLYSDITGPKEFISFIKYADYVITDSFHGVLFSIKYEKQFMAVKRFDEKSSYNQNFRLDDFLKRINLKDYHISEEKQLPLIDYKKINIRYNELIEESKNYLINALKINKGKITSYCTSCTACVNVCPKKCITLKEDIYGDLKAFIDKSKCINCGLCKNICPSNNKVNFKEIINCYAAEGKDKLEIKNSSSGGISYLLGKNIIKNGGVVYGAVFSNHEVYYKRIDNLKELVLTQGSKYNKSKLNDILLSVKNDLIDNKEVLFTGNSCHIAGLYKYLKKDYSNLYTVDIICHGNVPSRYLKEYILKYTIDKNITVSFRKKQYYQMLIKNDKKIFTKLNKKKDKYLYPFLNCLTFSESCYHCLYATKKRISNITIGDFWGLDKKNLKDFSNPSAILINDNKGKKLFSLIKEDINFCERNKEEAIMGNAQLQMPTSKHQLRNKFNELIINNNYNDTIDKCGINRYMIIDMFPKSLGKCILKLKHLVDRLRR